MKTTKCVPDEQKPIDISRAERIAAGRAIAGRPEVRDAARTVRRVRSELSAARAAAERARGMSTGYLGGSWRKSQTAFMRSFDPRMSPDYRVTQLRGEMRGANLKYQQRLREEKLAKASARQSQLDAVSERRRARESASSERIARGENVGSKRTRADRIAAGRARAEAFVKTIQQPEKGSEMHKKLMGASLRIGVRSMSDDKKVRVRVARKSKMLRGLFYMLHEEE